MMLEMSADTVTVTCFECDVLLEIFADTVILACIECDVRNICRHRYCGLFWVWCLRNVCRHLLWPALSLMLEIFADTVTVACFG